MSAVNPVVALKYGFELIVYLAIIFITGGIIVGVGFGVSSIGVGLLRSSLIVGGLLMLIGGFVGLLGYLVLIAGQLGIGYKVIADGVQRGVNTADLE